MILLCVVFLLALHYLFLFVFFVVSCFVSFTLHCFASTRTCQRSRSAWDVSVVTNMSRMFCRALSFNWDLSAGDVAAVTDMSRMFMSRMFLNGQLVVPCCGVCCTVL